MKNFKIVAVSFLSVILVGILIVCFLVSKGFVIISNQVDENTIVSQNEEVREVLTDAPVPKKIIVLDAGHGKSSSLMSDTEKLDEMWIYNSERGVYGEWRHWKSETVWNDCNGSQCSGRVPSGGSCFYRMTDGDRSIEPKINFNNAMNAKIYLEEMGHEVRMTRTSNEQNPSMTKRLTYCYNEQDINTVPDADVFVCIHSNAGGGRGSAYMTLSGAYDQAGAFSSDEYVRRSNALGEYINNQIVSDTSLSAFSGGRYDGLPAAILFCKSPIPIAYLEIGFFDNYSDLDILRSESKEIGKAIAVGIDNYFKAQ